MDIESEIDRIQSFVKRGNFHAALNLAISALNECRRIDNQACADTFLLMINNISITMAREFGSKACCDVIIK